MRDARVMCGCVCGVVDARVVCVVELRRRSAFARPIGTKLHRRLNSGWRAISACGPKHTVNARVVERSRLRARARAHITDVFV